MQDDAKHSVHQTSIVMCGVNDFRCVAGSNRHSAGYYDLDDEDFSDSDNRYIQRRKRIVWYVPSDFVYIIRNNISRFKRMHKVDIVYNRKAGKHGEFQLFGATEEDGMQARKMMQKWMFKRMARCNC